MSDDDIDRLVAEHRLARQTFDDAEVVGFWEKAVTARHEAGVAALSADTALQIAYRACLQATLAVLAVHGLRPHGNAAHYVAFYAMQKLGREELRSIAARFDELRSSRAASVYEPRGDEGESRAQLDRARAALDDGLPLLREYLVRKRARLAAQLSPLERSRP